MKYYARVNTADPRTGLISVGTVLDEKAVTALGEGKIRELVERGVLGEEQEAKADPNLREETQQEAVVIEEPAEETDDDLPELDMPEDLVTEEEPKPKPKAKGGRKK